MMKSLFTFLILGLSLAVLASGIVDLNNLFNYANQFVPPYILADNSPANNSITDKGATLGRVLFYDKKLSLNNSISCASCHKQAFAFGDTAVLSKGINGYTERHTMRLANSRFSSEPRFFWDERAATLETQVTQPIRNHAEMGFSGMNGDPGFDSLLLKLKNTDYYPQLFQFAFGDSEISESRIQLAIAQFIRSIQSFDSKFDTGRAMVPSDQALFPNYTILENQGKTLFLTTPQQGGAGCFRCHNSPEFSIDSASLNNGVIGVAGQPADIDLTNTRAPSLRNLVNPEGKLNGPLMHTGEINDLEGAVDHYNYLVFNPLNTNLDPRLDGPANDLTLDKAQKVALIAFLKTLTGSDVYVDEKWSNPFDTDGNISIVPLISGVSPEKPGPEWQIFPNPIADKLFLKIESGDYQIEMYDASGNLLSKRKIEGNSEFNLAKNPSGIYLFTILNLKTNNRIVKKIVKR